MCSNRNETPLADEANRFLGRLLGPQDILTTFGKLDLIKRAANVSFMEIDLDWLDEAPTAPNLFRVRKGIAISSSAENDVLVLTEGEHIEVSHDTPCIEHPYPVDDLEDEAET